ncbi:alpha/beta fold hydrolase [Gorillibacterium sp. sgz5001074]|uniref:alpha/beta fold hydrolase n=1 Tax=Gorillibacterium sp. sgz5001074 TaxID=3446695 RepID=UPI003F66F7F0
MKITIEGVPVQYTVSGSGRDVLLLHGWRASLQSFGFIQESLSKDFKVYALDFPGFGESGEPPVPWGVDEYARFVGKFIEALGIEDPIILGHSHGGRTAIRYAADHPVRKLVLVDSAGVKPKRSWKYYVRVYTYKAAKHLLSLPLLRTYKERILNKFKSKLGSSDYSSVSPLMQQTMVRVVNADLTPYMPKIQAPTLLIWGELDTATPLSDGRLMEKLIPNAGLAVLKNATHWSFVDKPREFLIILHHFLESDKGGINPR